MQTEPPTSLEQQLIALIEAHNLSSISIGLIRSSDPDLGIFPSVYAQGDGFCGSSGYSGCNLADAVQNALNELAAQRAAPPAVALPAIEGLAA